MYRYSPERPLPPHPGRGGFECDGSGGIEIYLPPGLSSLQSKCLGDCLRQHEDSHIQDFQTRYRNVCKGRRNGERPTFDSPKQNNDSEKKAYDSELNCLQAKLNGLNGCEECKDTIESRMKEIPLRRRQYE